MFSNSPRLWKQTPALVLTYVHDAFNFSCTRDGFKTWRKTPKSKAAEKAAPLKLYFYFIHVAFIFSPLGLGDPASGDGGGGVRDDQRAEGKSQSISRALSAGWETEQTKPAWTDIRNTETYLLQVFWVEKKFFVLFQELVSDNAIGHTQPVFQFLCPLDKLMNEDEHYGGVWGLLSGLAYFLTPGQEEEEVKFIYFYDSDHRFYFIFLNWESKFAKT